MSGDEKESLEQSEKVYADLAKIYPENEGYLRKYAEILMQSGKSTTATQALNKLYDLLETKDPNKAAELARKYPQVGRISKGSSSQEDDTELGLLIREELGFLWIKLHQRKVKEGHRLYTMGDQGDSMSLVLDGEMAVYVSGDNQKTILLDLIGPNDVVGEACFLNPGERSAHIVANRDSTIVEIPRNKLLNLFLNNPDAEKILQDKADLRQMTSLLSTNSLLQGIPLDMRVFMASSSRTERYKSGTLIRQAGQIMDEVDMLIWGKASFILNNKENVPVKLGDFRIGELVGDTSALRSATCPASIISTTDVLMAHIPLSSFTNVVEAYPPFKEKLLKHAQMQRTRMMQMVANLKVR